jgi:hypothetical protein
MRSIIENQATMVSDLKLLIEPRKRKIAKTNRRDESMFLFFFLLVKIQKAKAGHSEPQSIKADRLPRALYTANNNNNPPTTILKFKPLQKN